MSIKIERINSTMIKEISYILASEVKDKELKFVTVTDCKVTSDLSFAKIYVRTLNDDKIDETINALNKAKGFIRKNLSSRMDIRHVPELNFVYDESLETGKKIEDIIKDIRNK